MTRDLKADKAAQKIKDDAEAAAFVLEQEAADKARELLLLATETAVQLEIKLSDMLEPLRVAVAKNEAAIQRAISLAEESLAESKALRVRLEGVLSIIESANHV